MALSFIPMSVRLDSLGVSIAVDDIYEDIVLEQFGI